ncbi:putative HTH-type transcriptional regulator [Streptomyces sp. MBT84]|uniref:helix-turn-helix transcriptional regulator n=1 Tax=Streptomyces sp. MBT84 TaxID=1488414 RepID=UPI001C6F0A37|nr:helix-turn-helix transcriptional regulator [Streptomyces sp. MBT84]MBW8699097.1 putative HTH-type transcriptional regulator [Streptomyces sp. MBT84]
MLRGRTTQCHKLERLLSEIRAGHSAALVITGEPGIGKSALLDHVAEQATGCHVARICGVEAEMEIPFAGLHQLCAPMLGRLEHLPSPQRDALGVAFGLGPGNSPDRLMLSLAVLSLLSEMARKRPLVCLIDDAQWLDEASLHALTFAGRRLLAEPVLLVFAVREIGQRELLGLPELLLTGLGHRDARLLLASTIHGRLDARVRDRIVAETHGNPLALLELPRGLTPAELAGGFGLPDAWPLTNRIEQSFLARVKALPPQAQRLMLIAAAEPVGDVTLLWRAAARLGLDANAAAPAEDAGLFELTTRARFRHPLVRSAVYRAATVPERQAVHRALAEATDPHLDPDRRAWHRAHASSGPDEAVARELEKSADRAQARGGMAAAAAFLQRATELTPDPAQRAARALAAAQAKLSAAAPDAAYECTAIAEIGPLDELQRARLERLRAQIAFARRRGSDAPPLLLHAARRLEPFDSALARETYLEAFGAAVFAGRISDGTGVQEVAKAARKAPAPPQPPRAVDLLLDGLATRFTQGYAAGLPPLREALHAFRHGSNGDQDGIRWLWLMCPVAPEPIAPDLWDDDAWHALAIRAVELAREADALSVLPLALASRAAVHVAAGEFTAASALIEEANALMEATGHPLLNYTSLILTAWRGHAAEALELIRTALNDARSRGEGRTIGLAGYATAVLYNGLGDYARALVAAQQTAEEEDLGVFTWTLTELVEAAARSDRPEAAAGALQQIEARTRASGTEWALGIQAQARAMLSEGRTADNLYREAIERLAHTRISVYHARARLVYGEWLRRENRRLDAREQLHAAHDAFSRFGAKAFAQRARRELLASGATAGKQATATHEELTTQEEQIAQLARQGHTNAEIGTQLFISNRTVEWHLRHVYAKLGITSRKELRAAGEAEPATSS